MVEIVIERVVASDGTVDDEVTAAWLELMPQLSQTAPAPTRAELTEIVAAAGSTLMMARNGAAGPIVGMLCLTVYRIPTSVQARVDDVVVDERSRGRGIGEALMNAAIERARQMGATSMGLTSHPRRAAANRLYVRMGFERRDTNVYALKL